MRKKVFYLVLLLCGTTSLLQAQPLQDKSQLERERKEIQKELSEIQGMYNQVKGQTRLKKCFRHAPTVIGRIARAAECFT